MKAYIADLVIEVTRRCNMCCAHCCRGEAENIDITHEVIDRTLANLSGIGMLVFSGGEPSLNTEAIEYTLEVCKRKGISVSAFYVVTNAKCSDRAAYERFIVACLRWYAYCDDRYICGVAQSLDMFHDEADSYAEELLRGLAFFREEDKKNDWENTKSPVINEGRAKELSSVCYNKRELNVTWQSHEFEAYDDEIAIRDNVVYVNVLGEVLPNCDMSYESQRECACKVRNMDDAIAFFERAATDPNLQIA